MYAVGQFTLTPLGDKYGPRWVLTATMLIAGLSTVMFACVLPSVFFLWGIEDPPL